MKDKCLTVKWNNVFSLVLGFVTFLFVIIVLTGLRVPFAEGGQTSFIVLVVLGGIGCAVSETQSVFRYRPTRWRWKRHSHPITIAGQVLGILALILIICTFNGISILFITGYDTAFRVLAIIIFALFGLNIRRNAILK